MKDWSPEAVEAAQNKQKGTGTRTAGVGRHNPAPGPVEARTGHEMPKPHYTADNGAATWLLGPYNLSRAARFTPGRMRLVLAGPADDDLLGAVHAAVAAYLATKTG